MKNAIKLVVAAALVACAGTAFAQSSASTTSQASAEILYPITLNASSGTVNFGNIIAPSSNDGATGKVWLDMNSNISYQFSDMNPGENHGSIGSASFSVTGEGGYNYTVSIPSVISYSVSPAWGTMTLTFPTSPVSTYPNSVLTLSGAAPSMGSGSFGVGGMLTVPQDQPLGPYSATFGVTVQYQ